MLEKGQDEMEACANAFVCHWRMLSATAKLASLCGYIDPKWSIAGSAAAKRIAPGCTLRIPILRVA